MKKVFFIITVVILLFGIKASAEEFSGTASMFEFPEFEAGADTAELFALTNNEIAARDQIANGMKNFQNTINFSGVRVSLDRIFFVVIAAYLENPECYYVNDRYTYHYATYNNTSYVFAVSLTYLYDREQVAEYNKVIESEKAHVLAMMDEDMTDLEKVMLVHNYIAMNHTYDYSYSIYNIYDFFTKRTGVCQAYTLAMTYFLRAARVECVHAHSHEMNHVWNLVKLEGNWYHVDTTWDDTVNDNENACSYRYFLKSDDEFVNSLGHYNWESAHDAISAWYDDYYFTDYKRPFLYSGGQWYVLKEGNLYRIANLKYGEEELCFESGATYKNGWHPYYDMSFAVYDDNFIYNVYDEIYTVNLNDFAKPRKIADAEYENYKVYCLNVNDDTLYYKTGRMGADSLYTLDLSNVVSLMHFEIMDMSADGEYVYLRYNYDIFYDREWSIYVASYNADNIMIDIKSVEVGKSAVKVPEADRYEVFIWEEECVPLCENMQKEM